MRRILWLCDQQIEQSNQAYPQPSDRLPPQAPNGFLPQEIRRAPPSRPCYQKNHTNYEVSLLKEDQRDRFVHLMIDDNRSEISQILTRQYQQHFCLNCCVNIAYWIMLGDKLDKIAELYGISHQFVTQYGTALQTMGYLTGDEVKESFSIEII